MLIIYSRIGLVCQSYSGRYMLMGNFGCCVRSIQERQKKEAEAFRICGTTENKGFLRQRYFVARPASFWIIQPSNHNRKPEKRIHH